MKDFRTPISYFLTVLLLLAITPPELFHHHEEPLIICGEDGNHVEDKRFECELGDIVTPLFTYNLNHEVTGNGPVNYKFQEYIVPDFVQVNYTTPQYRGPPSIV